MTENVRSSTGTYDDSGGNSIVDQTTDIINRFRNSIVRSRKEHFLDEDILATENIVDQLHFTELINKKTLTKLISQGNSMERSYGLINQLEKEIKEIAEDLNQVNGGKCWGAYSNGTLFGFTCFGCLNKKKKKINRKKPYQQNFKPLNENRLSFAAEHEEILNKTRGFSKQRREHPDFVNIINQINDIKRTEIENNDQKVNQFRDYLLQNHSLSYGYIDEPDRLITEINLAIQFNQINTRLDHLLQMNDQMSNEVNQHNIIISKIETQAMESGNLLTDYTLLGHHILGSSPTNLQTITNTNTITPNLTTLGMTTGEKALLNSVL